MDVFKPEIILCEFAKLAQRKTLSLCATIHDKNSEGDIYGEVMLRL